MSGLGWIFAQLRRSTIMEFGGCGEKDADGMAWDGTGSDGRWAPSYLNGNSKTSVHRSAPTSLPVANFAQKRTKTQHWCRCTSSVALLYFYLSAWPHSNKKRRVFFILLCSFSLFLSTAHETGLLYPTHSLSSAPLLSRSHVCTGVARPPVVVPSSCEASRRLYR